MLVMITHLVDYIDEVNSQKHAYTQQSVYCVLDKCLYEQCVPKQYIIVIGHESSEAVADPGVVPRVPGHHPKLQGYTTKLLTSHILHSCLKKACILFGSVCPSMP